MTKETLEQLGMRIENSRLSDGKSYIQKVGHVLWWPCGRMPNKGLEIYELGNHGWDALAVEDLKQRLIEDGHEISQVSNAFGFWAWVSNDGKDLMHDEIDSFNSELEAICQLYIAAMPVLEPKS